MPDRSLLSHFERDAVLACLLMAAAATALLENGWRIGLSIWAGGLLAAISYRGLKAGVNAVAAGPSGRGGALVKFFTRHAILAFAAYVMLARLRLHPLGLIAGASSLVMAAGAAAVRVGKSRSGNPR